MSFEKLAAEKRYSCRSFEQRPIEKPDMDRILEAGRIAPTAANTQPQRIIAINTPEGMRKPMTRNSRRCWSRLSRSGQTRFDNF